MTSSKPTLNAAAVMTSPVIYVMVETTVCEVAKCLLEHDISAVPVLSESGQLVGMVSEGDLVGRTAVPGERRRSWWLDLLEKGEVESSALGNYLKGHGLRAKDVMSAGAVTVDHDTPIEAIAELLEQRSIKRVPVLRDGKMVGIVSRANLLKALAKERAPS